MMPIFHFIASLILFLILYPYFGIISLLVFLGGWLIDVDHMLYYTLKFKSLSYRKANHYFKTLKTVKKKIINIFHTIEFWIVMSVLSFYNVYVLLTTLGIFVHVLMDFMHLIRQNRMQVRYLTVTGWLIDILK